MVLHNIQWNIIDHSFPAPYRKTTTVRTNMTQHLETAMQLSAEQVKHCQTPLHALSLTSCDSHALPPSLPPCSCSLLLLSLLFLIQFLFLLLSLLFLLSALLLQLLLYPLSPLAWLLPISGRALASLLLSLRLGLLFVYRRLHPPRRLGGQGAEDRFFC